MISNRQTLIAIIDNLRRAESEYLNLKIGDMEKLTHQTGIEIAIDFDGTCVTHEFPKVGKDIGAVPILKRLVANGHKLILYTMRSNRPIKNATNRDDIADETGMFLQDALDWFSENEVTLYGIQSNPNQGWTTSPKCYAHLYIDDAALGCPLIYNVHERPYVDWDAVANILWIQNLI